MGQYFSTYAQRHWDKGISAKFMVELAKGSLNPRLGINAGLGFPIQVNAFMPAVHLEYQLYYRGFGTRSGSPSANNNLTSDLVFSGLITAGIPDRSFLADPYTNYIRNSPLYYFTDLVQPALQNPFKSSISIGTNFVWAFDPGKQEKVQQVGFVNLHIANAQLGFSNDGGGLEYLFLPFLPKLLGDGKDRYNTGGGFLAISLPSNFKINSVSVSYNKFSGYYKNAFEDSNELDLAFVNYKDTTQQYYNKSYWQFSAGNVAQGFSGYLRLNNVYNRGDFQNSIHYIKANSYHFVPYPKYTSVGGSYFNQWKR